jgi:methylenetetrahydrofolate dehydrogenase (NADP+)/methenyltetrahydrofolate cyclohydrolase
MQATVIDGKQHALRVREGLVGKVQQVLDARGYAPGLGVILVGEDPASAVYVHNKEKAALGCGMHSEVVRLPHDASVPQILAEVKRLNQDERIDGFLVQLPLPKGVDAEEITQAIDPSKDADGLHPLNLGRLMAGIEAPRPCTPWGVMALLDAYNVRLQGAQAVVVGRSTIVGKPMSMLLLERHATVTVCHSRTQQLSEHVRSADVVVAAVGVPGLIQGDWIKKGAVVIDVGINRVEGRLVGDVDYSGASQRASAITPVPGGVGPMTVAMLLSNTVESALRRCKVS